MERVGGGCWSSEPSSCRSRRCGCREAVSGPPASGAAPRTSGLRSPAARKVEGAGWGGGGAERAGPPTHLAVNEEPSEDRAVRRRVGGAADPPLRGAGEEGVGKPSLRGAPWAHLGRRQSGRVDHKLLPRLVVRGRGLEAADIGAVAELRHPEAAEELQHHGRRQVLGLLLRSAAAGDGAHPEAVMNPVSRRPGRIIQRGDLEAGHPPLQIGAVLHEQLPHCADLAHRPLSLLLTAQQRVRRVRGARVGGGRAGAAETHVDRCARSSVRNTSCASRSRIASSLY